MSAGEEVGDAEQIAALRAALELLASPAERQGRFLSALRRVARQTLAADPVEDPIDVGLHRRKVIADAVIRQIEKIDEHLSELLEEEDDPFDQEVMAESMHWREIRALARRGLIALGR